MLKTCWYEPCRLDLTKSVVPTLMDFKNAAFVDLCCDNVQILKTSVEEGEMLGSWVFVLLMELDAVGVWGKTF